MIATALYSFAGLDGVVGIDVGSFIMVFVALQLFIKNSESRGKKERECSSCNLEVILINSIPIEMNRWDGESIWDRR